MSQHAPCRSVACAVTVAAAPERAFEVFTDGFQSWWPPGHSLIEGGYETVAIEPHVGGRWFERGASGVECVWGYVTAYEPPHRILLSWHLDGEWDVDEDPARATEVEVRFTPVDGGTRVELEHRGFERRADGAAIADGVGGEGGWGSLLEIYARAAAA